jgi:hypothetical protein
MHGRLAHRSQRSPLTAADGLVLGQQRVDHQSPNACPSSMSHWRKFTCGPRLFQLRAALPLVAAYPQVVYSLLGADSDGESERALHDEPLKGDRKGQRSIRLNQAYRAIYVVVSGAAQFVRVEEVNKHRY